MLRIASACSTREAFVALFGRYCDGEVIFVATRQPRPTGEELAFTITLAGGEPLISATGRVEESYREGEGPHGRGGMIIRFRAVSPESRPLLNELAAVPTPEGGFALGTASPGIGAQGDPGHRSQSEPDSETRPSGLPRALAGRRASIATVPGVTPHAGLGVKPAATPAPVVLQPRGREGHGAPPPTFSPSRAPGSTGEGRDEEGPTGVKSMQEMARSRVRYSPGGSGEEFEGGPGWDPGTDEVFDPRARGGARMALRADSMGRLEGNGDAPGECELHEESGSVDERGLPNSSPVPLARPQDTWEGDETLPPWLRGPAHSDDLDVPTGTVDFSSLGASDDDPDYPQSPGGDALASDAAGGDAHRGDAHRGDPHRGDALASDRLGGDRLGGDRLGPGEPALSLPASLSDPLGPLGPSRPGSIPSSLDHRMRAQTAPPPGPVSEARDLGPVDLRPRRRWPVALAGALFGALVGLGVGYAMGAQGLLDELSGDAAGSESAVAAGDQRPAPSTDPAAASAGAAASASAAQAAPASARPRHSAADDEDPSAPAAANTAGEVDTEGDGAASAGAASAASPDQDSADAASPGGDDGVRAAKLPRGRALAAGQCGIDVESDPAGSELAVGGQVVGTTPTRLELPCGVHELEARRSRYEPASRRVRLRPGKLERVALHLARPDHKLRIVSAPLGASVTVNGRAAGVTPLVANVKGYQQIRVRIERPGFETWARKVYAREPLTKLTVKLTPDKSAPAAPSAAGTSILQTPIQAVTPPAPPPASGGGSGGR
ncbi:MAG TPA: PEGA domain-containing protein [Kofleriaceae bacterium]|nr:PEGA domain-containing protein [Kofleriaceae bacterium]